MAHFRQYRKQAGILFFILLVILSLQNPRAYAPRTRAAQAAVAARTASIDPSAQYQTLEGWGMSLAWAANLIASWTDPKKRDEYMDLFFSPTVGLGFNIARYNIGGGENPDHAHMRKFRQMPGYEPAPGVWDWSADANQRWMLLAARARGARIFEAFSNSPPYWMTNSYCASGAYNAADNNLRDDQYAAFADYLTEVVKHFRDDPELAITFRTLEPLNEPFTRYWSYGGTQEGCHFNRDKQNQIIKEVGLRLQAKGLTVTSVSAPDETSFDDTVGSYASYDDGARSYISQINTHAYGGSDRAGVRQLAEGSGKRLWMSEYGCCLDGVGTNEIRGGLRLSNTIRTDLKALRPAAWILWQPDWGLVESTESGFKFYKQYFALKNYSRFIRPGYRIIGIDDEMTLAAFDEATKTAVIVTTNDTDAEASVTYDLSKCDTLLNAVTPYRTSADEDLVALPSISISNKKFTAVAKARSITTYVINGVSYTPPPVSRINDSITGSGNNQFEYVGSWKYGAQSGAYMNDIHWSDVTGDYYQVRFEGTQINLYAARDAGHGVAGISIDGGAETFVDFYAADRADNVLLYTSQVLAARQHTLKVRVTGSKNSRATGQVITADAVEIISAPALPPGWATSYSQGVYALPLRGPGSSAAAQRISVGGMARAVVQLPGANLKQVYATPDTSGQWPQTLANITVTVGGVPARVLSISPAPDFSAANETYYIDFAVPDNLTPDQSVSLTVRHASLGREWSAEVPVEQKSAPALWATNGTVAGQALAQDADSLVAITSSYPAVADGKTRVILYGTGLLRAAAAQGGISVIGRNDANGQESVLPLEYAGAQNSLPGLDQIIVRITPAMAGGSQITIRIAGNEESRVSLPVK